MFIIIRDKDVNIVKAIPKKEPYKPVEYSNKNVIKTKPISNPNSTYDKPLQRVPKQPIPSQEDKYLFVQSPVESPIQSRTYLTDTHAP